MNTQDKLERLTWVGTKPFKGVWDNREYPLFALDREHADKVHTSLRKLRADSVNLEDVAAVCWACADSTGWPSALYLRDSGFGRFKVRAMNKLVESSSGTGALDMEGVETPVAVHESEAGESLGDEPPLGIIY